MVNIVAALFGMDQSKAPAKKPKKAKKAKKAKKIDKKEEFIVRKTLLSDEEE